MIFQPIVSKLVALAAIASLGLAPVVSQAQTQQQLKHRQQTKNTWRNIGIGSAAVGALGLLKGNSTLAIAGIAGGLYSASRYEHDRKSQGTMQRRRAAMFRKTSYWKGHHHYVRRTTWKHGQKYYYFARVS